MIIGWWSDVIRLATSFSRCNPMWFLSMGSRQGSGLCSSSSRKYPGTKGTNQNRHWNHHRWHATNSLERTRLSCWCLLNHKGCTYRAPVRYVTKTWSVVLLIKKKKHILLSQVYCVRQVVKTPKSFRRTLYILLITEHNGDISPENEYGLCEIGSAPVECSNQRLVSKGQQITSELSFRQLSVTLPLFIFEIFLTSEQPLCKTIWSNPSSIQTFPFYSSSIIFSPILNFVCFSSFTTYGPF